MSEKQQELYKKSGDGIRTWKIRAEGNAVITEFGLIGGKIQCAKTWVRGKNTGRSNATTPEKQALLKAGQLYRAKIKEGFLPDLARAKSTKNALGGVLPMLAHVFEDYADSVTFPCYVQPKLDGVRCLARVRGGICELFTRSQKPITTMPHIQDAVEELSRKSGQSTFVLDGEMYSHALRDDFGKILGTVKRGDTAKDASLIQYHVYDIVDRVPFQDRTNVLQSMLTGSARGGASSGIVLVDTIYVHDMGELKEAVSRFVRDGYEGGMYRSVDGEYAEGKRSRDLLKMKTFRDDEFMVTGYQNGTGKLDGFVGSWICKTDSGVEFRAKQEGSLDSIPSFDSPAAKAGVGQWLTVRFQNYTKDGAPRFPVAVRFRRKGE